MHGRVQSAAKHAFIQRDVHVLRRRIRSVCADERTRLICSLISIDNHGVLIKSLPSHRARDFGMMFVSAAALHGRHDAFTRYFYNSFSSESVCFSISANMNARDCRNRTRRFHGNKNLLSNFKLFAQSKADNFTEWYICALATVHGLNVVKVLAPCARDAQPDVCLIHVDSGAHKNLNPALMFKIMRVVL